MKPLAFFLLICSSPAANLDDLRRGFEHPPDDTRIMMRWWWFGPAATKPELEREMRAMKDAGIGGFEVQPVYPLDLEHNYPYLSDEFLDALRFTAEKAKELGLRMDLTLGSGWPFGGPHISIDHAAGKLRVEPVRPALGEGETQIAELSDLFFVSSRTRQVVKRAAVGAEGFVLDHYDRAAIDTHLRVVGDRLLNALGENRPYAVFSDSLEVEGSDWTPRFLDEFRRRRGYDLTPYLGALLKDGENAAAIRHDWGLTLTELANENYLTPIRQWAAQHGTRFRSQTYGTPPVNLSSNALVDLPEGEGWTWRQFSNTRWASSANHLYHRNITSSETWTWLHSPVFRATPLDLKAEADLHFLEGVNQIVGHGWPYSPPEAGEPGWHFYAAAALNDHNPWWIVMPDVASYLQRVSFLLRQGEPVADVAIYLPTEDAYARFTPSHVSVSRSMDQLIGPRVIPQILDAGYNFDFIDDAAIARQGIPYRVLIVPGVERMPLRTLEAIDVYVKRGGSAIATRRAPSLAPGLKDDSSKVHDLSQKIFASIHDENRLGEELRRALPPDLATAPEIGFVHRKTEDAEIYFVVNTSNHVVHHSASFRATGFAASFDPFSGKISAAGGSSLDLNLAPYESRVIVFSKVPEPGTPQPRATEKIDLSADWQVTIDGISQTMHALHSWTDDPRTKQFSGSAIYQKTVVLKRAAASAVLKFGDGTPVEVGSEKRAGSGMRAWLENPVREAAVVYVNGARAGSVWCPPYEIEVGSLLKAGENTIRVVVANTALNAMRPEDFSALNAKYGERFQPQDMDAVHPLPSGMLGPVQLIIGR